MSPSIQHQSCGSPSTSNWPFPWGFIETNKLYLVKSQRKTLLQNNSWFKPWVACLEHYLLLCIGPCELPCYRVELVCLGLALFQFVHLTNILLPLNHVSSLGNVKFVSLGQENSWNNCTIMNWIKKITCNIKNRFWSLSSKVSFTGIIHK